MTPQLGPDIDRGPNPEEGVGDAVQPVSPLVAPAADPADGAPQGDEGDVADTPPAE